MRVFAFSGHLIKKMNKNEMLLLLLPWLHAVLVQRRTSRDT